MAGYNFGDTHTLRLMYESGTQMPEMLQMSDARILIMNNFYQTGNPDLENAHRQSWRFSYDLYVRKFTLQASLFYDYTRNSLFDAYRYGEGCILYQTDNARQDVRRGGELNLNCTPWKYLHIGGSVEAAQQLFQPSQEVPIYRYWTFPVSVYVSANYKNFALDTDLLLFSALAHKHSLFPCIMMYGYGRHQFMSCTLFVFVFLSRSYKTSSELLRPSMFMA